MTSAAEESIGSSGGSKLFRSLTSKLSSKNLKEKNHQRFQSQDTTSAPRVPPQPNGVFTVPKSASASNNRARARMMLDKEHIKSEQLKADAPKAPEERISDREKALAALMGGKSSGSNASSLAPPKDVKVDMGAPNSGESGRIQFVHDTKKKTRLRETSVAEEEEEDSDLAYYFETSTPSEGRSHTREKSDDTTPSFQSALSLSHHTQLPSLATSSAASKRAGLIHAINNDDEHEDEENEPVTPPSSILPTPVSVVHQRNHSGTNIPPSSYNHPASPERLRSTTEESGDMDRTIELSAEDMSSMRRTKSKSSKQSDDSAEHGDGTAGWGRVRRMGTKIRKAGASKEQKAIAALVESTPDRQALNATVHTTATLSRARDKAQQQKGGDGDGALTEKAFDW